MEFDEEAHNFIAYLTPEKRLQVCLELSEILRLNTPEVTTEKRGILDRTTTHLGKYSTNYRQLFQCKNDRNAEIIIRKVSQTTIFQQHSYLEIFFNFNEISLDFIYKIIDLLQQEMHPQSEVVYN